MIILDTGHATRGLTRKYPGKVDCWRIVDYGDSQRPFSTRYTFEALNITDARIVGYPACSNDLDEIRYIAISNGLRGVRQFIQNRPQPKGGQCLENLCLSLYDSRYRRNVTGGGFSSERNRTRTTQRTTPLPK